jgi:small subunit ribosomal protein S16
MPVKMRLARHGRKRYAYYHVVIADSRAPRDGRYIERIGTYNPNSNPATIDLDFDKAFDWLTKGAQPTDTVRQILSYKGVLYKMHLAGGVKKGAFDEAEAEKRLDIWITEKEAKVQAKIDRLAGDAEAETQKQLEAETKIKEDRSASFAARDAELVAEADAKVAAEKAEREATKAAEEAAKAELVAAEEAKIAAAKAEKEAAQEATKAEIVAKNEAAKAEVKEAPKAKAEKAEAPKTEVKETPEAEAPKTEGAES